MPLAIASFCPGLRKAQQSTSKPAESLLYRIYQSLDPVAILHCVAADRHSKDCNKTDASLVTRQQYSLVAALVMHKCTRRDDGRTRASGAIAASTCWARGVEPLARRAAGVVSAALALIMPSTAQAAECKTKPGALYAVRTCARYGVQGDGRLAGCLPSENCVSSSAIKSPAQFDAPWLFSPATRDADRAFEELVKAAQASPDLKIAETDPARRYLRATAPSQISNYKATDVDDVEVLISAEKGLVFHRSASRESVFFFPPQNIYSVPLGDNGSNRGRLEARCARRWAGSRRTRGPRRRSTRRGPTRRRLNSGCS